MVGRPKPTQPSQNSLTPQQWVISWATVFVPDRRPNVHRLVAQPIRTSRIWREGEAHVGIGRCDFELHQATVVLGQVTAAMSASRCSASHASSIAARSSPPVAGQSSIQTGLPISTM